MLRVGLTGGIACGKTRVMSRLEALGVATLDLDVLAHEVMAPGGAAYEDVVATFGSWVVGPDGAIDRKALGAVVFGDPEARKRLEGLMHPRIRDEEGVRLAGLEAEGEPLVVSDAALIVEAGRHLRYDCVVVVHCPPDVQKLRLKARDGLSDREAERRLDAQMPIEEKRCFAHLEVDTSASLDETDGRAEELGAALRRSAGEVTEPSPVVLEAALGGVLGAGDVGPRGLDPRAFLEVAVKEGDVALQVLASRLVPGTSGPWYRAAAGGQSEPWPETLAVPLALWALAHDRDEEWLLGAASSLARLTHRKGEDVSAAAFAALAAWSVARSASLEVVIPRLEELGHRAVPWGRAAPAPRIAESVRAALRHPHDPSAASRTGGGLAGGLVGLVVGAAPADVAGRDVELVRAALSKK